MTHRTRFLALACAWSALVLAALLTGPLALRDRLPDPIATHWGFSGDADDATSLALFPLLPVVIWVVAAAFAVGVGWSGKRRSHRGTAAALLGATGTLFCGITASTIAANLDRLDWRLAALPVWHVSVILAGAGAAGLLGFWLGSRGPDEPAEQGESSGELPLDPARRAVWVSSASSPVMLAVGGGALLVAVAIAGVAMWRSEPMALVGAGPALLVSLVISLFATARVHVDERGVRTALGPLRRPVRRIPLSRITAARVATYRALEVGGWGYRLLPGSTAIMLRGGDCLVLRLTSGRDFVISVDRPDRGAELVNALLAERAL